MPTANGRMSDFSTLENLLLVNCLHRCTRCLRVSSPVAVGASMVSRGHFSDERQRSQHLGGKVSRRQLLIALRRQRHIWRLEEIPRNGIRFRPLFPFDFDGYCGCWQVRNGQRDKNNILTCW